MLLGMNDIRVDEEQLAATVPVSDEGTSLAELREAAAGLGLEMTLRRCSIEELHRQFQAPFIAHLAMVTPHYSVVIDISDDFVTFLDGTTGELETLKRSWVEERWSGYVLLPQAGTAVSPTLLGATMLNCLVVGFLVTKRFRDSGRRP
jgi:ABC-type bacteriocin/lantibiotic exporter with double-glycine peptidase domain